MTPLELSICLHYHSSVTDIPWLHSGAPIADRTFDALVEADLLTRETRKNVKPCFKPTPRLHAFVEMLTQTPLPIRAWIDPRTRAEIVGR